MMLTPSNAVGRLDIVNPFMELTIRIYFDEILDEHEGRILANVCLFPITAWRNQLSGEFSDLTECEGAVYYRHRHRPVDLRQVVFGSRAQGEFDVQIRAVLEGEQEESVWNVCVNFDEAQFDSAEKELLRLCEGNEDV